MIQTILIDGLAFALPMFIMAIGGIYSEKSGVTNLALEGLQGFGAFTGALAAVLLVNALGEGSSIPYALSFCFAVAGGALYALFHALLCIKFKADQVISGVVVNILSVALTTFLTGAVNTAVNGTYSNKLVLGVSNRFTVPLLSKIPWVGGLFTNMYPFEIIILALVVFFWVLMYKTRFGMRLRACGENPQALDAAGGNVEKVRWIAVIISGALSGIGGICFAYSLLANFSPGIYLGYGYLAIAAMIFGNWNIGRTAIVCVVFGLAKSGGYQLCLAMKLPSIYSDLFLMLPYVLTMLLLVFFSRGNQSPKAVGQPWDKSKR